jgi:hypothetical protein
MVNAELARLVRPGGQSFDDAQRRPKNWPAALRRWMRPEDYGHVVMGYDVPDLEGQLRQVELKPYASSSYSRFFTEMLELAINFLYVKVLSKRSQAKVEKGQIAPQNIDQVKSVEKTLKLYSLIYPVMAVLSAGFSDRSKRGYAVIVAGRKD